MACRSTHSVMILMNFGLASHIVPVVVLVECLKGSVLIILTLIRMAMAGLTVVMVVHRLLGRSME